MQIAGDGHSGPGAVAATPGPGAHLGRRGRMIAARAGTTPRPGGGPDHRGVPYFLDRINTGNRYYHKVHVFPVSRPKARTATGHRFDPVNPKDEDACGSESICAGCSRPTIEVGGSGATALTCSAKGKRHITRYRPFVRGTRLGDMHVNA